MSGRCNICLVIITNHPITDMLIIIDKNVRMFLYARLLSDLLSPHTEFYRLCLNNMPQFRIKMVFWVCVASSLRVKTPLNL